MERQTTTGLTREECEKALLVDRLVVLVQNHDIRATAFDDGGVIYSCRMGCCYDTVPFEDFWETFGDDIADAATTEPRP